LVPLEESLHLSIDNYFEKRRLLFPRLFFMTDKQCLEFISNLENKDKRYNELIPLIFPGASGLLTDEAPCPKGGTIDHNLLEAAGIEELAKIQPEATIEGGLINGLVSKHSELLLFQESIPFNVKELARTL
jgi:hypothetical protein